MQMCKEICFLFECQWSSRDTREFWRHTRSVEYPGENYAVSVHIEIGNDRLIYISREITNNTWYCLLDDTFKIYLMIHRKSTLHNAIKSVLIQMRSNCMQKNQFCSITHKFRQDIIQKNEPPNTSLFRCQATFLDKRQHRAFSVNFILTNHIDELMHAHTGALEKRCISIKTWNTHQTIGCMWRWPHRDPYLLQFCLCWSVHFFRRTIIYFKIAGFLIYIFCQSICDALTRDIDRKFVTIMKNWSGLLK